MSWALARRLCARLKQLLFGDASREITLPPLRPQRPMGMCAAQRVDFVAACEGKITWRQYYAKWGNNALTL